MQAVRAKMWMLCPKNSTVVYDFETSCKVNNEIGLKNADNTFEPPKRALSSSKISMIIRVIFAEKLINVDGDSDEMEMIQNDTEQSPTTFNKAERIICVPIE